MMGDEPENLMVNLSTEGEGLLPRKQKIKGNRQQRIKARKAARFNDTRQKQAEDKSLTEDGSVTESKSMSERAEFEGQSPRDRPDVVQKPKGTVISSLFNRNPEIPRVPQAKVTPVKEQVFSPDSFHSLQLHPFMVSNLEGKMGLKKMTTVQCKSLPVLLKGQDALIRSQTGSGKTLAYAIPVVQSLQALTPEVQRKQGPYAVVLVPTRELAIQSEETFQKLVQPFIRIVPGCVIGGERRKAEKARLRKGLNIVIATPGRLLDHIEHTNCLDLSRVRWLILDEADRLLDLGYEKDVARIITAINERSHQPRQTVMLSATLTQGVERLAGITLNSPEKISVTKHDEDTPHRSDGEPEKTSKRGNFTADMNEKFSVPDKLKQLYVMVPCKLRLVTLASFIIWKCKDSVEFHHKIFDLSINGRTTPALDGGTNSVDPFVKSSSSEKVVQFFKLHGDMLQKERTTVYQEFSQASSGVLLCTDVAARGLDLPKVRWIVQFSPGGCAEYIHRVGRTARAGAQGHSLLFLMPDEVNYIKTLHSQNISLRELPMEDILKSLLLQVRDGLHNFEHNRERPRTYQEAATFFQLKMEEDVERNKELFQVSQKAYQSFVKAYATYPAHLKSIFHVKNLHLGHLAKSFALRDTPRDIGIGFSKIMARESSKLKRKREVDRITFKDDPMKKRKTNLMSEFSSGSQCKRKPFSGPGVRKRKKARK